LKTKNVQAQGPYANLALHTIGWKAFQDLAAQVCEERLKTPVTIHHESKDGGQDAIFLISGTESDASQTGTVQVKYSSDPHRSLKLSDLTPEIEKLKELIDAGQAETYIFVTNMSVAAPDAKIVREKLIELGVKRPDVWGKQQITLTIKSSSRLRALIPQVYGLGDISSILDQRAVEQTKAILKVWLPKLKAYVPTKSHEQAVRNIDQHGVVLLLGNPASGKSAIGAILSTMAVEDEDHSVIQVSSPQEFVQHWNPDFKNRFFWIDDAFGSNVVDTDVVQHWAKEFGKVSAAINGGNRFLFTSRGYIYKAAESKLGSRNLSLFRTGDAVVNVGELSEAEKIQILYNHIKHGKQTGEWKSEAKPHLASVAGVSNFLPGISARLGNPDFTKKLPLTQSALVRFMAEPEEHLIDVLNELEPEQFASLVLIYVHRGKLDLSAADADAVAAIEGNTGFSFHSIVARLPELEGSFVQNSSESSSTEWVFDHPTIADAITAILDKRPNMTSAILRGGPIEKIMNEFVCEGAKVSSNAAKIPKSLNEILNQRLSEAPDNLRINGGLFSFLAWSASDEIVRLQFESNADLMDRSTYYFSQTNGNAQQIAAARAFQLGVLRDQDRSAISDELYKCTMSHLDLSWTEDHELLALMEPTTLLSLGLSLSSKVAHDFDRFLEQKRSGIDLDIDIEDQYEVISSGLKHLKSLLGYRIASEEAKFLENAEQRLAEEIAEVLEEQEVHRAEQEDDGDWDMFSPTKPEAPSRDEEKNQPRARSIFQDVDID
jgi:hypothetical protein